MTQNSMSSQNAKWFCDITIRAAMPTVYPRRGLPITVAFLLTFLMNGCSGTEKKDVKTAGGDTKPSNASIPANLPTDTIAREEARQKAIERLDKK